MVLRLRLLFVLLCVFHFACIDGKETDTLEILSSVKGADMNIYRLYMDKRECDRNDAMEYAEMFLSGLDSLSCNETAARLASSLAEYKEKEQFMFSEAIRWYGYSAKSWKNMGNELETARCSFRIARLYYRLGQYHKTLRYITEARRVFESSPRVAAVDIAECDNLSGAVYQACGDYETGYEYFRKYAEKARELNDSIRLVVALNNAAVYSETVKDTMKTRKLIQESFGICQKTRDTSLLCQIYQNIAAASLNAGMVDESEKYLKDSRSLLRTTEEYGVFYRNMSLLNYVKGNLDSAEIFIRESVRYFDRGEFFVLQQRNFSILHEICAKKGDEKGMYYALNRYYEFENKLGRSQVMTEFFNYQNEMFQREKEEQAVVARNKRTMVYGFSIQGFLFVILISYLLVRKKTQTLKIKEMELQKKSIENEKNEQELKSRNEILEMRRMQQYQIDRLTQSLICDLQNLESEIKDVGSRAKISAFRARLAQSMDEDQWKEMTKYIPEFNTDFFRNLLNDYPDLSVNERRLCALLNLNMSTKEIAEITHQSPNTINIARAKLRAKFGLTGSASTIQEFLSGYASKKQ